MKKYFFIVLSFFATLLPLSDAGAQEKKFMNPQIGINALMLYRGSNNNVKQNGFGLQEAELQFASDVDPYWKMKSYFAIGKEDGKYKIEPEELVAETTSIPDVTLTFGRFPLAISRTNTIHTHALPFIDHHLTHSSLFGSETLKDTGASIAYLLPASWYSELKVQATNADNETFKPEDADTSSRTVSIVRWSNLWDLSDSSTFEFNVSYADGPNRNTKRTSLTEADMTYKWRPVEGGKYSAFSATVEWMNGTEQKLDAPNAKTQGGAFWVQHQFAQRWWAQARTEYFDKKTTTDGNADDIQRRHGVLLGFFASEFSGLRLQADQRDFTGMETPEKRVLVQLNFSIGAHPAHTY